MKKEDIYYQAMLARDHRFDGKFFIGVKTTGIYCRPICPARPKRENVEFFSTSWQAQKAGYRPCMRCRPECAPDSPVWKGTSAIVIRAIRILSEMRHFEMKEEDFAAHFGVSARHLRRLFMDEIGLTPKKFWFSLRLNFARKLLSETTLPLNEIAESSGFRSLRRFNAAFKEQFRKTPRDFRSKSVSDDLTLYLAYRPPFHWTSLLEYFRHHYIEGLEYVGVDFYERSFYIDGVAGWVRVYNEEEHSRLRLELKVESGKVIFEVCARVRRLFDLDSDPLLVMRALEKNVLLKKLMKKYPGLRVPGAWCPFEAAVCTVLGQLVSLTQARRLSAALVAHYGEQLPSGQYLFASAENLSASDLSKLGTTQKRKQTIRLLAQAFASGEITLNSWEDVAQSKSKLLSLAGIGPWSVEYIALRALRDTDAFPRTDLILKRVLQKYEALDVEAMRPWRAYVALYLWREFAHQKEED